MARVYQSVAATPWQTYFDRVARSAAQGRTVRGRGGVQRGAAQRPFGASPAIGQQDISKR